MKKIFLFIIIFMMLLSGCGKSDKSTNAVKSDLTPQAFLKFYDLKVQKNPHKFKVDVPKTWNVGPGQYPIGLFWQLANEFSKDVGLDLTPLKGTTVDVWRYSLVDGLPDASDLSKYKKYPSNLVLLVNNQKVVGAWLAFNQFEIGPSVKKHYLKDITGLDFEDWVQKKSLFTELGKNKDIASLDPVDVVKTYFKAINDGDKTRAYECLAPTVMLDSLTDNLGIDQGKAREDLLYNLKFVKMNSMVEGMANIKPISFILKDSENHLAIKNVGNRTEVEVDTAWLNSDNSKDGTFVTLKKYANGWKIKGMGNP
ncbi:MULTISPECIES: DUF4830 domain-containing protein [Clostridium]|uniref:DUF4830 domain-containing protein n=4 Tax=Clostridium TaxID=1485 RepID=D8GJL5_CLOLD|nr:MULTISPECIES: DUF4829 domain-containing protein [Clostridium]ADK15176.1 conserved hypothetical protein [Clostridium ljungdahlii DSM 13528]AGY74435.1 DUF4829 domain-containing protein [Clostridium autoethanogenum DSM 10061]ALU34623.1 Hypothetical protein CLAU_0194 [Clostridium autoethanogenum DSM 10061]OAA88656.1 hypothetical protein WX45_02590 [Clostridium ljungdahlii DSM 13528]OVY51343.1 hypothetical protein WX72_01475 [Clostridium autoethanogenum]